MKMFQNKYLLTVVLISIFFACGSGNQTNNNTVDAEELKTLLSDGIRLVDIRTPDEYASGRIAGATLIDYRDRNFRGHISKLEKDTPIAIYCASGGRSTRAMEVLTDLGFSKVYHYKGGFNDWKRRGETIEID